MNTTLTQDQTCTGDSITIGASGITLDLNDFTVSGDHDPGDFGLIIDGVDNVTVRGGGTIRDFFEGVFIRNASHVTLHNLWLLSNADDGLDAEEAPWLTLYKLRANDNEDSFNSGDGADIDENSHHFRIKHSTFNNNGSAGVDTDDSSNGLITKSKANNNNDGFDIEENDYGVVSHNKADGNSRGPGFELSNAVHMKVIYNVATDTGDGGFEIDKIDDSLFRKNIAKDNGGDGFDFLNNSSGNTVLLNKAINNGDAEEDNGFEVCSACVDNDFRHNVAKNNYWDGFKWHDEAEETAAAAGAGEDADDDGPVSVALGNKTGGYGGGRSIQGLTSVATNYFNSNVALRNGDNGFDSSQPGVVFRKNVAGKNDDFGIYAPNTTNGQIGYANGSNRVFQRRQPAVQSGCRLRRPLLDLRPRQGFRGGPQCPPQLVPAPFWD